MTKYYTKEIDQPPVEVKDFDFKNSEYIYQVRTQDSSGYKVYYSKTKDEAWRSL